MWLENPLVGGRRALTLGRGASLRAARFAGAFLPAGLPGATRLREAALPEDALAGAALAGVLAVVFDLPAARDAVLPARPPGREVPVCAFFAAPAPPDGAAGCGPPSAASRSRRTARSSSTILRVAASTPVRVRMPSVAQACSTWRCTPPRRRICASTSRP